MFLNGNPTTSTGANRKFATTQMANGDRYTDYDVRAEVVRNGQRIVRQQKLSLVAGQTHELTIDFAGPSAEALSTR